MNNILFAGNLMTYMVSYMHVYVDASVSYSNILWVASAAAMGQGLFMPLGGLLSKVLSPRMTCILGCSIMRFYTECSLRAEFATKYIYCIQIVFIKYIYIVFIFNAYMYNTYICCN